MLGVLVRQNDLWDFGSASVFRESACTTTNNAGSVAAASAERKDARVASQGDMAHRSPLLVGATRNSTPRRVYARRGARGGKAPQGRTVKRRILALLALCAGISLVGGGDEKDALQDGIFGISGIIPDPAYFEELRLDHATSGFWIGASEGFFGGNKEALHTRQFRTFAEYGIRSIGTFYLGDVDAESARWAEEIVRYYSSGQGATDVGAPVLHWELGDEQNGGWGTSCSPEEYARRVGVLAPAIRRGCPECSIVMGGLLDGPEMGDWALAPYLRRFLAVGGGEWIDVYAFHYYGLARPDPAWAGAQLYDSAERIVDDMRAALAEHGLEDRPIWVTETSTFSGRVGAVEQSESEQAADLVKRYVVLWALGVDVVQWCYLTEPQYEGTGEGFFDQSGLVYDGLGPSDGGEGVKKRAYHAYVHMVERLRAAALVERSTEGGITCCHFATEEGSVSVLWQDPWTRDEPIWIEPAGALTVEDLRGRTVGRYDGRFRLDLGIEPVYLLGDVESISQSAPALEATTP